MTWDITSISPYVTALIVAGGALLVGACNQKHRTLEKRLDDLYSPLFQFAWLADRALFPQHGSQDYLELLDLLHKKNYLMSVRLHYFYVGYVISTKPFDDAFAGRQDEFINIVKMDYEAIRRQYISFQNLLKGLLKPDILGYSPTLEAKKCPKCGEDNAPTNYLCGACKERLWKG